MFTMQLNQTEAKALQKGTDYYRRALWNKSREAKNEHEQQIYAAEFLIINRIDLDLGIYLNPDSKVFTERVKYGPVLTYNEPIEHDARLDVFG